MRGPPGRRAANTDPDHPSPPGFMPPLPRAPQLWTRAPMAPRCPCDAIVEITGYTGSLSNLAVI